MESIQIFIDKLKIEIIQSAQHSFKGLFNALDDPSKEKHSWLKKSLPELERILKDVMDELNTVSPQAGELKKQMDEYYLQKNIQIQDREKTIKESDALNKDIILFERNVKTYNNDIMSLEDRKNDLMNQIKSKKDRIDELFPQVFIPFYGIHVANQISDLHNQIDTLNTQVNHCYNQINECQGRKEDYIHFHSPNYSLTDIYRKRILETEKSIEDYDQKIAVIHEKISISFKNIAYLTILKERINNVIIDGENINQVMTMLNKSPKIIHYGKNQDYFDMLEKWNQSHDENVFKDYIMKSEKEFFNS